MDRILQPGGLFRRLGYTGALPKTGASCGRETGSRRKPDGTATAAAAHAILFPGKFGFSAGSFSAANQFFYAAFADGRIVKIQISVDQN